MSPLLQTALCAPSTTSAQRLHVVASIQPSTHSLINPSCQIIILVSSSSFIPSLSIPKLVSNSSILLRYVLLYITPHHMAAITSSLDADLPPAEAIDSGCDCGHPTFLSTFHPLSSSTCMLWYNAQSISCHSPGICDCISGTFQRGCRLCFCHQRPLAHFPRYK